jgi:hypothetical protein
MSYPLTCRVCMKGSRQGPGGRNRLCKIHGIRVDRNNFQA